jgi:hypothetical protein
MRCFYEKTSWMFFHNSFCRVLTFYFTYDMLYNEKIELYLWLRE